MSTRCNIILKDKNGEMYFYRHSDGYPKGALPLLKKFLQYVKDGVIRDNVSQAGGWLIIFGAQENADEEVMRGCPGGALNEYLPGTKNVSEYTFSQWKVGAIEPSLCLNWDIEYLYEIDLDAKTLKGWAVENWDGDLKKLEEVDIENPKD